jgi:hypothetical protein
VRCRRGVLFTGVDARLTRLLPGGIEASWAAVVRTAACRSVWRWMKPRWTRAAQATDGTDNSHWPGPKATFAWYTNPQIRSAG